MKTQQNNAAEPRLCVGGLLVPGLVIGILLFAIYFVSAFPPAPHHSFYGMVRNEMGDPLLVTNAEVVLESLGGTQVKGTIVPNLDPGINYRLNVPMDAGTTADNYKPTALRSATAFRMKIKIGNVTYLPIETAINFASLGKPAKSTRMDLTLGEDLDGDGLPDAWERALIAMLGGNLTIYDINPNDDSDGDGISNWNEYIAGTYPFDPEDGLRLEMVGVNQGRPVLEFLTIPGRHYTIHASSDLKSWSAIDFKLSGETPNAPLRRNYSATSVRYLRLEAVLSEEMPPGKWFFKAQVQ